jgi:hypothetical protein
MNITKSNFESRIKTLPEVFQWQIPDDGTYDGCNIKGNVDYSGLTDIEKMALYIYSYSRIEVGVSRHAVSKQFGWSKYKVSKLRKELDEFVETQTLFSDDTGLIGGRGYVLAFD